MPIISSEVWKIRNRGNGRLAVFEKHVDHNGQIHEHRYSCPVGHDTDQELLNWVPKLEAQLIDSEKEQVQQAIENGEDPATINLKHLTTAQKAKRAIKALMAGSPYKLVKAAKYIEGFTNAQIESHFSEAQRIRIRARQAMILNNEALFLSDTREEL